MSVAAPQTPLWTVGATIEHYGAVAPGNVALRVGDVALTSGDLRREVRRAANAFVGAGATRGTRFAVFDKNRPEFFTVMFGGTTAGAVHTAVNWRLAPPEVQHVVTDAQVRFLFVGAEFFPTIEAIEDRLPDVTIVALDPHDRWPSLETWLGSTSDVPVEVEVRPEDDAFQFYTSGTTGLPKGVVVTHEACFTQLHGMGPVFGLGPTSVSLMVMPTFHIAGTQWSLNSLVHGAQVVVLREFDVDAVLEAVERYRVTHTLLVPAMIQFILESPRAAHTDFTSLEMISYGASPIAPSTLARALDIFGCRFCQTYGLTEAAGAVSYLAPADHDVARPDRLASAGRPAPWCEVRILSAEDGSPVPTGEVGEICIRSRAMMRGYWGVTDNSGLFYGDWLRTGDAGYFDADGFLHLHDRVKDMIVTGGENVYPAEVEHVLAAHPAVADVAVIGIPDDRWGEAVHAVVVAREGQTVTHDELVAFARGQLAGFKLPKSTSFVDALPRNPSGKVLKNVLREKYWAGKTRAVN